MWPQLQGETRKLSASDAAVLARVDAHYNHLHSLRTNFSETYDGLGLHRVEQGTLLLKKPGRMRWSYTEPNGKLFVLDGKYAYSYAPGDAQAQRLPAKQMDDLRSPLRLLLGKTELRRELTDIEITTAPTGDSVITGHPVVAQTNLRDLTLHVDGKGQIQSLRLTGNDNSTTSFSFRDTIDDVPTSEQDFQFSPPVGVPIVDGLAPI